MSTFPKNSLISSWILKYKPVTHSGFAPATKVYMADGSVREIKDVSVGDLVVGDDGLPRRVLQKFNGYAQMYMVRQNKGDDYIVSGNQMLVLRATAVTPYLKTNNAIPALVYYKRCSYDLCGKPDCCKLAFRTKVTNFGSLEERNEAERRLLAGELDPNWVKNGDLFAMNVKQHAKICNKSVCRDNLQGYKSPLPIFMASMDLPLDPYFVGIWLGDGTKTDSRITSSDPEIKVFLDSLALRYNLVVDIVQEVKPGDISIHGIVAKKHTFVYRLRNTNPLVYNPIIWKLKVLDIFGNKHIPDIYMNASEENRYRLLAGLIDTDGWLNTSPSKCAYGFSQSERNKGIVYQVQTLARTLGITAHEISTQERPPVHYEMFKDGKKFHTHYTTGLTGENILKIPCLIERKQASVKGADHHFNSNNTSKITIQPIVGNQEHGTGEYVGIVVDGNNMFILSDCTIGAGSS